MSVDAKRLAATLIDVVRAWVEPAFGAVAKRLEALEKQPRPRDGRDGNDAPAVDELALVARVLNHIPAPKDGRDGIDGKDAQPVDEAAIVARVLELIPTPKDGKDGRDGESVHPDTVRAMVADEVRLRVADVPRPRDGRDGSDGRDAALIEPLPEIDESRSYPRGVWAKHAGGLWLSRAPTQGMAGWDCIVAGVAAVEVVQTENERGFSVNLAMSDARIVAHAFTLPAIIYREVWRDGTYERGDVVTWGGSAWHCQRSTTEKPGIGCADWKLMVKEGRPGKDGGAPAAAARAPVRLK